MFVLLMDLKSHLLTDGCIDAIKLFDLPRITIFLAISSSVTTKVQLQV